MAPANPSPHFTPVAPLSSFSSFDPTGGLPPSGISQDVYFKGGSFGFSLVAFSTIGYLYRSKNRAVRKPRTGLRDLLLPAVVTRDDPDHTTRPATGRLLMDISAPYLVSSTNAASDPYYFERHIPQVSLVSEVALSNTSSDTKWGNRPMFMEADQRQLHPHKSTPSIGHSRSLPLFHTSIGDIQDITDMMSLSVYSCDSAEPERHSYILSMPTIPRIALQDLSDNDCTTSFKNTYDFKITAVGSSVRQGDFLQLPNGSWPRISHSRSFPSSPRGIRRGVRVVDIAKYTHALSAPVRRLPVAKIAHEDPLEIGKESEDENESYNFLLAFIEEGSSDLSFSSKEDEDCICAPRATSDSDGALVKSSPVYPNLEPPAVVHFQGKHRRSRAASYQITPGTSTERGDLIEIQPFSSSPAEDSRWASKNGMMVVKVYLPFTDEIWAAYVPTSVTLSAFTSRWMSKLDLSLRFSASVMDAPECYFDDDEAFRYWVNHRRIWRGRNVPIVGHLDCVPVVVPKEA